MAACSSLGAPSTSTPADDSIHSNTTVQIDGGTLTLASGDDGIHADATVEFNGGQIDISKSYEGIEANSITLNDGTVHIVSSDDGINGVASTTESATAASATAPRGRAGDRVVSLSPGTRAASSTVDTWRSMPAVTASTSTAGSR